MTEEVHKKIQNNVLASALQDFIHIKRAFAFHAIKIVKPAPALIVSIVLLVLVVSKKTAPVR